MTLPIESAEFRGGSTGERNEGPVGPDSLRQHRKGGVLDADSGAVRHVNLPYSSSRSLAQQPPGPPDDSPAGGPPATGDHGDSLFRVAP
jgi:hypothetical protein